MFALFYVVVQFLTFWLVIQNWNFEKIHYKSLEILQKKPLLSSQRLKSVFWKKVHQSEFYISTFLLFFGLKLSQAESSCVGLSQAESSWVKLSWDESRWVELSRSELSWVELSRAELSWVKLSQAELSWVELSWAQSSFFCVFKS